MVEPIAIGGVMAAADGVPMDSGSLWALWADGWRHNAAFGSARSALAAVLRERGARRVWLPAYVCTSLAEGAEAAGIAVRFFECDRRLDTNVERLTGGLRPGDAVVGVDYFGRAPGEAWREMRDRHADVIWIEDRAQAFDPAQPAWGDIVLYSPRKLVGVADGGIVFSQGALPAAEPDDLGADPWAPEDARALDPEGRRPKSWYPLFQAREAAVRVDRAAMTARTLSALKSLPAARIAEARRANWRRLAVALGAYALWPDVDPVFAPLAFPIVVDDAAATVRALAERRIWAPRHWAEIPGSPGEFPDAHWLSSHCVSLPLDQRYGAADMDRLIQAVKAVARPATQPR